MINLSSIIEKIITELYKYMNIPVIIAEQNTPKPGYPHLSIKVMNPYMQETTLASDTYKTIPNDDQESEFLYNIEYTRQEQPQISLSITAYSLTYGESIQKSLSALSWFKLFGYDYLKSQNIVVVETTQVQDRDILIVDNYERRSGFDIKLRVLSQLINIVPTIETFEITKE
jgi:hypothetical protein